MYPGNLSFVRSVNIIVNKEDLFSGFLVLTLAATGTRRYDSAPIFQPLKVQTEKNEVERLRRE